MKMNAGSVSRIELKIEIKGKSHFTCELKRHLAPKTVGTLIRSLPIEGNPHFMGNSFVYIETKINVGTERPRSSFKKGDIGFMSSSGSICFFFNDLQLIKPLTPIGSITSGADVIKDVKSGDVFLITQAEV